MKVLSALILSLLLYACSINPKPADQWVQESISYHYQDKNWYTTAGDFYFSHIDPQHPPWQQRMAEWDANLELLRPQRGQIV
jgi:hypothetical protein